MRRAIQAVLLGAGALAAGLAGAHPAAGAQAPRATATVSAPSPVRAIPTAVPTAIPTPVPPEREGRQNRGAAPAPDRRGTRYENKNVGYSKLTRVEEVDLDRDGVFEALVEGVGTVRSLPPDIPAVGFESRSRLPFENPILSVFKRGATGDWDLLLAAHLPRQCNQSDDPARCDELLAFRSVDFRFDDRPQVALQIVRAGEPRLSETYMYRLDKGRFDTTFSAALPRAAIEVDFGPAGITRRIAVDTFINKELPPRYRSFTLTTTYVFGERHFRMVSETAEPEWADRGVLDLSYWGLVHQPTFSSDLAALKQRQAKVAGEPWTLDPVELVKRRYPDARGARVFVKQPGLAVVTFERAGCTAHVVVFQPLREWDGEKSLWDFGTIRSTEGGTDYECLAEPPISKP
jgi:hypothetical protein